MKNLKEKFNDNEEGQELQEIFLVNDSNEEKAITDTNNQKIKILNPRLESINNNKKFISGKRSSRCSIKKILCIIISFLVILAITMIYIYLKYFSKKPTKPKIIIEKYNECQWFVDGKNYFGDLFKKLMEANNTIYIADWWLSPEVFLRRPVNVTPYLDMIKNNIITNDKIENMTRLMDILNYKAKQGVQIYILVYKEFKITLNLDSAHTENIFKQLDKNIKITRYPSFEAILWSNHEKLVIIDEVIAYIGGLDLCWGRYDNNQHPISEPTNPYNIYEFPFIDYSNNRVEDFSNLDEYYIENVPREKTPRMPWHDVQSRIIGIAVQNISSHFKQRWNYANKENNQMRALSSKENYLINKNNNNKILNENRIILFEEDEKINLNSTNSTLNKNYTLIIEKYQKYFNEDIPPSNVKILRSVSNWNTGITKTEHSILDTYYRLIQNAKHYIYIENQFFISKSWNDEERADNDDCINDIVQNKIAYYIRKRIEKAYKNNKNFKVYIFIPLLPAFKGDPDDSKTLKTILKYTYASINRNFGLSLIEQLEKIMGDKWINYIGFFSLRNHGIINNIPKTEIIYVHSKIMIIDDKTVIIGSANINERSMLGDRDSELAAMIEEKEEFTNIKSKTKFIMDGIINYNASNFAVEFRKALMAEHLGINQNDSILDDPVSDKLFSLFLSRAKNNTKIYQYIFNCYPDNSFWSFKSIKNFDKIKSSEKAEDLLNRYNKSKDKIQGHIVEFPLLFLKDETFWTYISLSNTIIEIFI